MRIEAPRTTLIASVAVLGLCASAAVAQEGGTDEKPDLELPEVIIRGIDESRLGVGEMSALREPEAKAIPLTAPPTGSPADVSLVDHAARTEYGTIHPPELPPPLTVRGFLQGGSYQSLRAGFDAKHQLTNGGVFGQLSGIASDGHLTDAAWSRTTASAGVVIEPNTRSAFRVQLTRRSREQDLPLDGALTTALNPEDRTQTFRQWAGDLRYRYEGRSGFLASLSLAGRTASFQAEQPARDQAFHDGDVAITLDMPLKGRLWSLRLDVVAGGRQEELSDGGELERERLRGELTGRVLRRGGLGIEAGVAFHRFGEQDVLGPKVRVSLNRPPYYRTWVGVEPLLREPDVFTFFSETPFARGTAAQPAEEATWQILAGTELQPLAGVHLSGEGSLRQSTGFPHPARADRGFYELAVLDERWLLEATGAADYRSPIGLGAEVSYTLTEIEGTRIPYVPKHRGRVGLTYRGIVELGVFADYLGERRTSPGEGDDRLGSVWLPSASAAVEIASRWWLALEARNFSDEYYREYAEYDAPGRVIEGGVRYTF